MNPIVKGVAIASMIAAPFWAAAGYGISRAVASPTGCSVNWQTSPTPYPNLGGVVVTPVLSGCNDGPYQTVLLDNGLYEYNAIAPPYAVWVPARQHWTAQFVSGVVSFTHPSTDTIVSSTSGDTNVIAAAGACHATFTVTGTSATAHPNASCGPGFEFTSWSLPTATGNSGETLVQRVTAAPWTVALPPCRYQLDYRKVGGHIVSATVGGTSCTTTTTTPTTVPNSTTTAPTTTIPPKPTTTITGPTTTITTPTNINKPTGTGRSSTSMSTTRVKPAPVAPIQPAIGTTG